MATHPQLSITGSTAWMHLDEVAAPCGVSQCAQCAHAAAILSCHTLVLVGYVDSVTEGACISRWEHLKEEHAKTRNDDAQTKERHDDAQGNDCFIIARCWSSGSLPFWGCKQNQEHYSKDDC